MRNLTADQKAALRDPRSRVVNLVEMGHPDGTLYLWSGTGTLTHDGQDYIGCGLFGAITGIEQGWEPRISQVRTLRRRWVRRAKYRFFPS